MSKMLLLILIRSLVAVMKNIPYVCLRCVFHIIQTCIWRVNGTHRAILNSRMNANYGGSVQVLGIMCRYKIDPHAYINRVSDFILYHERFEQPEYIFRGDISLYCITPREFVFVQSEGENSVWDVKAFAFSREAQYKRAVKVLLVPIHVAHRLAAELGGRPKEKLIFILNTSRCGSTLACQIFQDTDRCVAYSEPSVLNDLLRDHCRPNDQESGNLIRSAITLLCKPPTTSTIEAHVVKIQPPSIYLTPFLARVFPEARYIFMYRNIKATVRSASKLISLPMFIVMGVLSLTSRRLATNMMIEQGAQRRHAAPFNTSDIPFKPVCQLALMPMLTIKEYIKYQAEGVMHIAAVRYEDLIRQPAEVVSLLFEHCGLPIALIGLGLRDMNRDSQKGSAIARHKVKDMPVPEITPKDTADLKLMQKMLDLMDVLDDGFILPGTLQPKQA